MSEPPRPAQPLVSQDALPPVQPPSAGFIVQLFVVPGLIVLIIVMVWLMFNWLAQMGNDPTAYVKALKRNNEARWQAAVNLSNALRSDKGELKGNAKLAGELSEILNKEIDTGSLDDQPISLRYFLSRALGEFNVPDGLPVLLKAARTQRDPKEAEVRRAALAAIAVLAESLRSAGTLKDPQLHETLFAAADDDDPLVREVAAFTLGSVGDPQSLEKLKTLLNDTYPNVRYNAATNLAGHGDAASIDVLLEMLDPDATEGLDIEKNAAARPAKQGLIIVNALRASGQLAKANPSADMTKIRAAIEKLQAGAKLDPNATVTAKQVMAQIDSGAPAAK